ncbi:MAG: hypothetical protein ACD_79C00970G0002 [uncultured bacterium]|nr:MAG: hypothetical protein ACD_79C00970G0002 [uncultured bacterium]
MNDSSEFIPDAFKVDIVYEFEFDNLKTLKFEVKSLLDKADVNVRSSSENEWCKLDFHKCKDCPLDSSVYPLCPAADSISDIVKEFFNEFSYSMCKCTVYFPERTVIAVKPVQDALFSLIGLRMATSNCPFLSKFKPLARFHEPFASVFYTIYRSVSFFLLSKYFTDLKYSQGTIDFSELKSFYSKINVVNTNMSKRLNELVNADATPNCITILSVFGKSITYLFDDYIETLEKLFLINPISPLNHK